MPMMEPDDNHKAYPYQDKEGWWHPICCNCRNRRSTYICRDAEKSGYHTIERCEGYIKVLQWR